MRAIMVAFSVSLDAHTHAGLWDWLLTLPEGAANFLGSFAGAILGLLAILAGALFNAYLNRRRDDRLRRQEARALAAALLGELQAAHVNYSAFIGQMSAAVAKPHDKKWLDQVIRGTNFGPRVRTKVYEGNVDKLGLLGEPLVGRTGVDVRLISEIVVTYDFLFDYARLADKEQNITRRELLKARGDCASQLRNHNEILLKETMAILQAYIDGGLPAATKAFHGIMRERNNRHEKLGTELGIVPGTNDEGDTEPRQNG